MIHLDTSFVIRALVRGSAEDHRLRAWLRSPEIIRVSSIVWTEFLSGPVDANQMELVTDITGEPTPFLSEDAALAARLFNLAGRRRGTVMDCMIAATAIRQGAALATSNAGDFRRFEPQGLRLALREEES